MVFQLQKGPNIAIILNIPIVTKMTDSNLFKSQILKLNMLSKKLVPWTTKQTSQPRKS